MLKVIIVIVLQRVRYLLSLTIERQSVQNVRNSGI